MFSTFLSSNPPSSSHVDYTSKIIYGGRSVLFDVMYTGKALACVICMGATPMELFLSGKSLCFHPVINKYL